MKKKLLSALLATMLLLTCIPLGAVSVSAATSGKTGSCTWTLKDGILTISGSGAMADYEHIMIDSYRPWDTDQVTKINIGNKVTKIGNYAFTMCNISSVTIPDSVTVIGEGAFNYCENLTKATIGNGVKAIGESAFGTCCSLKTVSMGKNITTIGDSAFGCCESLTSIVFPDTVTKIGSGAFADCNKLTSITLGKKVKTIADYAFTCYEAPKNVHVYYRGSKTDKKSITIKSTNTVLLNATWHYNYTPTCKTHSYKTVTKKATASANGYTIKRCSECNKETGKTTIYKANKVTLSKTSYTYNGKAKKPAVTVKDSKGKKIAASNYTVTYASGRKNVGTYKVTIKFKGKYSGTKTLTFKIVPRAASINTLTAKSKAITVKLNRSLKQSTGYQIQYSTNKNFKSAKTKTLSSYKTSSTTLSGLKAKTTYYVRVRTYKTVNGKKVYSAWSSAKSKKTK